MAVPREEMEPPARDAHEPPAMGKRVGGVRGGAVLGPLVPSSSPSRRPSLFAWTRKTTSTHPAQILAHTLTYSRLIRTRERKNERANA